MITLLSLINRFFRAALVILGLFSVCMPLTAGMGPRAPMGPNGDMFNISEEEMNQIVEALNDLTPDQLKELEELGRATEERMRQQNLDPNNPTDWMKFMEKEGLMQPQAAPPKPQPQKKRPHKQRQQRPRPQPQRTKPPVAPKPLPIAVTSKADTKVMIEELISHLESLKQKASTRSAISRQLGAIKDQVDQLDLYLYLVRTPDIIALLSSKDFEKLHTTLEDLHKSFMSLEPSISARERSSVINTDDPYEVLDLPYSATQEDIEARYADLASERSPAAIEAQLILEDCDNKVCNRIVKSAARTFNLIQRSYDQLKNPETRKEVDSTLTDKITQETEKEQTSMRAFNQLFSALSSALTSGRVVTELQHLLEKYKPQELAQAQEQQQREKEAFVRSKQRVIVPQVRPNMKGRQQGPYDAFYRKMGQNRYGRPTGPRGQQGRPGRPQQPGRQQQPKPQGGPAEKGNAKPSGGTSGAKKEGSAPKKNEKKEKKKAEVKPKEISISEKDVPIISSMKSVDKILSDAKDKKYLMKDEIAIRGGEPIIKEYQLKNFMKDVLNELTSPGAPHKEPVELVQRFYKEYQLDRLRDSLKKIAPGPGKKLNPVLKDQWQKTGAKLGNVIKDLEENIYKMIDPNMVYEYQDRRNIPKAKLDYYGLNTAPIKDFWKKDEEEEEKRPKTPSGIDLGEIRDTLLSIRTYYQNINDAAK